jgi:GT2 family glycosyltransferase
MAHNDGPCPARNAGMRAAANKWVLALDNDAIVASDTLEKLAHAVQTAPPGQHVVLAQPRSVFHSDPGRVHYDGGSFHYVGLISLRNFYVPLAEADGNGVVPVDCIVSVAVLVDRDVVLAVGGYDEAFFILFEDLDLSYRLRASGYTILSVEDAIVRHRGGTPGISYREGPRYPTSRVFYHSRNRWLFLAKNYRAWTLCVALPGLALYECVWLGFAVASGSLGAWLRGKVRVLKLLGHVRRERRACQSRRSVGDRSLLRGSALTLTPSVAASAAKRILVSVLDHALSLWWSLAGWAIPR